MNYHLFISVCDRYVTNEKLPQVSTKEGYDKIKNLAGDHTYVIREKLIFLRKKLIFEYIVNREQLTPYIKYIDVLIDAVRDNTKTKEQGNINAVDWVAIISVLGEIKEHCALMNTDENYEHTYAQIYDFSKACARLISRGISIVERDEDFYIDEKNYNSLSTEIERLAISSGGCNILYGVFNSISASYNEHQRRFQITRALSLGHTVPQPMIPWAYLIALGAKYSCELGDFRKEDSIAQLIQLLKDVTTIFELQDYTPYESWFVDHYNLTRFLSEGILFDNLFCIQQTNFIHAIELLNYIVTSNEFKSIRSYGFAIDKIYQAGLAITNETSEKQITDLDFSKLRTLIKLGKGKAIEFIDKFLLCKNPNEGLNFPPENTCIDHGFNQLLPFKDNYLLLPRSLSSLALINSTLNAIIAPDGVRSRNNDSVLGQVIERFVKDKLSLLNMAYRSGEFVDRAGDIEGESDIVIETETAIIFFEIKKKGMTRLSMSGVDYSILSDLGDGLIHASAQCFKAERVLRCDGQIIINNEQPIKYNSQRVFKIALTLFDYGSFQDRMTIRTILSNSINATFHVNDERYQKKLKGWEVHLNEISQHINALKKKNQLDTEPFHNLIFMSIPQLLMILSNHNSNESLEKVLRGMTSMSFSTRDFYKEYSLASPYF